MHRRAPAVVLFLIFTTFGCRTAQETVVVTDRPLEPEADTTIVLDPEPMAGEPVVTPGRFDYGKMWTFDNPPLEYFAEEYDFQPDSAWFEHARLGALRFSTYCSASFVSAIGLIMTNNHCARESVEEVSRPGEDLLANGFYAERLEDERRVGDLHVDQLISISDVTESIAQGLNDVQDAERRSQIRQDRIDRLTERLTSDAQREDSSLVVEIVSLYQGGRYAAYTFRRFDDVRLAMATEHRIGYYGGDYDNFTYPRYNLDYAFFRAYDDSGLPLSPERFFRWDRGGAEDGEVVFVVGSPGSTSRLNTVAQLEYQRDHELPNVIDLMRRRASIFAEFIEANPEQAEETKIRSTYLSITNQIKNQQGQLEGLRDPYLIARKRAAQRQLQRAINESDTLRNQFGNIFDRIADVQQARDALAQRSAAFAAFGSVIESQILTRAFYGYIHSIMRQRGFPEEAREEIRTSARETLFYPEDVERALLAERLEDLRRYLGPDDPNLSRIFGDSTPQEVADLVVSRTELNDSLRFEEIMDEGFLSSEDEAVDIINVVAPAYLAVAGQINTLAAREDALTSLLGRARLAILGRSIPPDASFSLRIADGIVAGYPYNGTMAPAFTTFAGMFDRYYSFTDREDWDLPERWVEARDEIDLSARVNLVTTNDITGGNSGSPLLNRDLEIVGLIFDSNIDALPNEFIYLDDRPRAISVDARGIIESLRTVYGADRLVDELLGHSVE
ncbi:MAG: S46 family peptidase [Bacteroidota bacterium]